MGMIKLGDNFSPTDMNAGEWQIVQKSQFNDSACVIALKENAVLKNSFDGKAYFFKRGSKVFHKSNTAFLEYVDSDLINTESL